MRLREDTDAVFIGIICDAHPSNVMFSIGQCNTIVHKFLRSIKIYMSVEFIASISISVPAN